MQTDDFPKRELMIRRRSMGERLKSHAGRAWLLSLALVVGSEITFAAHEPEVPEAGAANEAAGDSQPRPVVPEYRSPIGAFKLYEDVGSPDWKGANKRVGEIGGWRVYAREPFETPAPDMDGEMDKDMGKEMDDGDSSMGKGSQ